MIQCPYRAMDINTKLEWSERIKGSEIKMLEILEPKHPPSRSWFTVALVTEVPGSER